METPDLRDVVAALSRIEAKLVTLNERLPDPKRVPKTWQREADFLAGKLPRKRGPAPKELLVWPLPEGAPTQVSEDDFIALVNVEDADVASGYRHAAVLCECAKASDAYPGNRRFYNLKVRDLDGEVYTISCWKLNYRWVVARKETLDFYREGRGKTEPAPAPEATPPAPPARSSYLAHAPLPPTPTVLTGSAGGTVVAVRRVPGAPPQVSLSVS